MNCASPTMLWRSLADSPTDVVLVGELHFFAMETYGKTVGKPSTMSSNPMEWVVLDQLRKLVHIVFFKTYFTPLMTSNSICASESPSRPPPCTSPWMFTTCRLVWQGPKLSKSHMELMFKLRMILSSRLPSKLCRQYPLRRMQDPT